MAEDIFNALHPDDVAVTTAAINNAIEGKKDYDVDFRVVRPDDSAHWVNTRADIIRDEDGKPNKLVGVAWI